MADNPAGGGERDLRLDFFRGLALFFIFIDHIPENTLNWFTLPSIGFSDAAEIFIFISGYTAAMVYGRTLLDQGILFATAQIYRRVWQLYVAHIFLFVIFTAEVSYTIVRFNNPMYTDELRVGDFLAVPHIAIIKALLLQFQPTFLDILPLYIVLLSSFPLILLLLRIDTLAALLPALALYAATQVYGFSLHAYPDDQVWFFNPMAWQLLFVIGTAAGFARIAGRRILPRSNLLFVAAAIFVALSVVICLSWTIHGIYDNFPALFLRQLWPVNKTNLAALRVVHFLAVALVVVHLVPADNPFFRWRAVHPIILCGQQSLQVFCLGILLSVLGHFVLTEWSGGLATQILVNIIGFALMIGTAGLLTWYRAMDRGTARSVATLRAGRTPTAGVQP
ncbi:MAG: OpgC protein [Rhodospirillales bacterium]|jgi:hypothetical protein|nr:OpgC protein [Rhodospirillales bacterium]